MQALWLVRPDLTENPGGDTTQILETRSALESLGVTVDLGGEVPRRASEYDVVHLFHLERLWENVEHSKRLRRGRRPAVLSPIYWPAEDFDRHGRLGWQRRFARWIGSDRYQDLRMLRRWLRPISQVGWRMPRARPRSYRGGARYILETVKVVLPNSRVENEEIERRFRVARPSVVVPNAADSSTFSPAPEASSGARQGVLCVGRIEPRKNQLALIRALAGSATRLRLVAQPIDSRQPYGRQCLEEAGDNVEFLPWHEPRDLCDLYRESLVHACVSWYETPGLVSLEAALCECAVVSTVKGSVREYLLDDAHYCEPGDVASIREAVERALSSGPTPGLAERVGAEYSWEAAARKTLEGYEMALAMAMASEG